MSDTNNLTISAVPGIRVGHWTHESGTTGTTVITGPAEGMTASGLVLGGGPASREYALLDPARMMSRIDALLLTGGSAFGLAAADGVMDWLLEQDRGFETMGGRVPIVPAAAIFDLMVAGPGARPDAQAGYQAAAAARMCRFRREASVPVPVRRPALISVSIVPSGRVSAAAR